MKDRPELDLYKMQHDAMEAVTSALIQAKVDVDDRLNRVQLQDAEVDYTSEIEAVQAFSDALFGTFIEKASRVLSTEDADRVNRMLTEALNGGSDNEQEVRDISVSFEKMTHRYNVIMTAAINDISGVLDVPTDVLETMYDEEAIEQIVRLKDALGKDALSDVSDHFDGLLTFLNEQRGVLNASISQVRDEGISESEALLQPVFDMWALIDPVEEKLTAINKMVDDTYFSFESSEDPAVEQVKAIKMTLRKALDEMVENIDEVRRENRDYQKDLGREMSYEERIADVTQRMESLKTETVGQMKAISRVAGAMAGNRSDEVIESLDMLTKAPLDIDEYARKSNALELYMDKANADAFSPIRRAFKDVEESLNKAVEGIETMPEREGSFVKMVSESRASSAAMGRIGLN